MRSSTKHFLAIVFGVLFAAGGFVLLLAPRVAEYIGKQVSHSTTADLIAAGMLAVGFVCVLPANAREAVSIFRPALPWGRRSSDQLEAPLGADRRTMPRGTPAPRDDEGVD